MFIDEVKCAVEAASDLATIAKLERTIWQAWPHVLTDDEAQALADQLHAKRQAKLAASRLAGFTKPKVSPRRGPISPQSIARRRYNAACCPVSAALAREFTTSELSVVRVIADDLKRHAISAMCNGMIAAIAGCGVTVVKNTKRKMRALRMATFEERPRKGQRSLTTLVRFLCSEWKRWVLKHKTGGIFLATAFHGFKSDRERMPVERAARGLAGGGLARLVPADP